MFSIKHRLRWSAISLACAAGLGSVAASADTVVISASGPSARSYPAGKPLAAGSRIVLAAGDTLTLLDSRGTRTLRGPVTTAAEATATRASTSFTALVDTQNRRRPRTGAIRGDSVPKPTNIWDVNSTTSGTICVANPATVQIWRPTLERAATMTVTADTGASASAAFAADKNVTAWPASLPIAEGRSYVLNNGAARVRFTMVSAIPNDPAGIYAALDAKGCNAQRDLLVQAMKPAAPAAN